MHSPSRGTRLSSSGELLSGGRTEYAFVAGAGTRGTWVRAVLVAPYTERMTYTLNSALDASANFVVPTPDGGAWEARYVRRVRDYFIAYVSSHTGCSQACRFCHLTASGQTMMAPATAEDYLAQFDRVLAHYGEVRETQGAAERVNINWMSRGEALANPTMVEGFAPLREAIRQRAAAMDLRAKCNISTILPKSFGDRSLVDVTGMDVSDTVIYYSLYSLRSSFRRRWLSTAMPGEDGLDRLAEWQRITGGRVALHWAFIAGENDDEGTVAEILDAVHQRGLVAKFNAVRYNPFSAAQGTEPAEPVVEARFAQLAEGLGHPASRIVPRVGFDVKASCGMFVAGEGARRAAPADPAELVTVVP